QYAENLEANLADLHARVNAGTYRALPSRRKYIPKADGRQRPLGIAAIEDKIVQAAVVAILTPIYEAEFLRRGWYSGRAGRQGRGRRRRGKVGRADAGPRGLWRSRVANVARSGSSTGDARL